jgi:hypothetical protein
MYVTKMSASETIVVDNGPCPCGKGHISKTIVSHDNPWSSADIHHAIECADCNQAWGLDGSVSTLRSSEVQYLEAKTAEDAVVRPLRDLTDQLVTGYFVRFAAPTMMAEHSEMSRLGITSRSYDQYLKHRRTGGTPAGACYGLRNEAWLRSLATAKSRDAEFDQLIASHASAKKAVNDAYKSIVRRRIAPVQLTAN